jgi:hypothetical protein
MSVADTILQQLGGKRFVAMTGAKNLVGGDNYLRFGLPGNAKDGINMVKITLNGNDLYDVSFMKMPRLTQKALMAETLPSPKVVTSSEDVFCDMLQEVFTRHTGLYTRL